MRRSTIGSRWATPQQRYTGCWRQNPWINATLSHATPSLHDDGAEERQQKAAMRVWEDEGGSLDAHRRINR